MTDLKKQKEKTDGKGWGVVDFSTESPFKVVKDVAKKVFKKITDKKDKKKD